VVVLHHSPLPSALPITAVIGLRDRAALAGVLAGSDVRIVLAGHTHVTSAGALAGIPVWTPGALASTTDSLPPATAGSRLVAAPAVARIDLFDDSVIAAAVPVGNALIAEFDLAATAVSVERLRAELR
jgi:hypothetical protein